MTDVLLPVGTRPNFVKAASLVDAMENADVDYVLLHTGQHYDARLSHVFFRDLELPEPAITLDVGSGTHAAQTGRAMLQFERELLRVDPSLVVVVGDVNSTLACALAAAKAGYPVAHVEAGLRSFDERMPEEINRRLTDHLARYLFTTSADAGENLRREGIDGDRVELVGNTMVDTLLRRLDDARAHRPERRLGLAPHSYAVATLHRPENVDDPIVLSRVMAALGAVARLLPVVLPVHPRTRARLAASGLAPAHASLVLTEPLGYLEFVGLVAASALVLTDSGGLQEETTALGVPCLTLRESTERPVTVDQGSNIVVGTDPVRIVDAARRRLEERSTPSPLPPLWDGLSGRRIVARLRAELLEAAVLERSA